MQTLAPLDMVILVGYFVAITGIGLFLTKRASGSIEDYFLAGRHIPWYILGFSGVAGYLDMSGTMVQTSYFLISGVKGYWFCYRGAIALTLAFAMIFMGKWHRRAGVMTNAELMELRFGKGWQGESARLISAFSILLMAVASVSFFFVGSEKFFEHFIPFLSGKTSALILLGIILAYTMASGFYGVVFTDLLQALLILGVMVFVAVKAIGTGSDAYFAEHASAEWLSIAPQWEVDMPTGYESMRPLGVLLIAWFAMNIVQGFAQPFDSQSSQRFYAAKDERESALVPFQWTLLFGLRFLLMMGIAVLALQIRDQIDDPEKALPAVIDAFFPVGLKGVFIAALIAAAMSTLDTSLNSSAAYFVKDIYQRHLRPGAGKAHLVKVGWIATAGIVAVGLVIGWFTPSITVIWGWIIVGLVTGLLPAGILRWVWWRFNGLGYATGAGFGMLAAGAVGVLQSGEFGGWTTAAKSEFNSFFFILVVGAVGSIIGACLGKPADEKILVNFYRRIRPFGWWGPVRARCDGAFVAEVKAETTRDLWLLVPACVFQGVLFYLMTAVVVRQWVAAGVSLAIVVACLAMLWRWWLPNLRRTAPPAYDPNEADEIKV